MASYYLEIRSGDHGSASPYAQYIWRMGPQWTFKAGDLVAKGYGNMPNWCRHAPLEFWPYADRFERRNGAPCREIILALPRELAPRVWVELVEEFTRRGLGARPFQYAIHCPSGAIDGQSQPHAHILYSDRVPDEYQREPALYFRRYNPAAPALGGCKKQSGGMSPRQLTIAVVALRVLWAEIQNCALAAAGLSARVNHRADDASVPGKEYHLGADRVRKLSAGQKEQIRAARAHSHL